MNYFLKSLAKGVDIASLDKTKQQILDTLDTFGALSKQNSTCKLKKEFKLGKIDISSSGSGFLEVYDITHNFKDLLVEQRDLHGALRGDLVLAIRVKSTSRPKAKVLCVLSRANNSLVVYTKKIRNQIVGHGVKNSFITNIKASQKSLKSLPLETLLKLNATTCEIEEVLGNLNNPFVDEKLALALYGKEEFFSQAAEDESKSHGTHVEKSYYPQRADLTHLPFCTIDPIDAKDFDDAIYFNKDTHTLHVAIADVSEYVFAFGPTDNEAKQRGFSIYFPHKSIPMLPRTLSENICSLKPHVDRLAFCFELKLDPVTLEVSSYKLQEAVIHSKRRFTYEEVDRFLDGDFSQKQNGDDEVLEWLLPLNEFMKKIRTKRLLSGFNFRGGDIRLELDENELIKDVRFEHETPSHSLIEDCMLLANKQSAKILKEQTAIFRNHDSIDQGKVQELLVELELIGIKVNFSPNTPELFRQIQEKADEFGITEDVDKLLIRAQKKANYESSCRGHFGLGFEEYAHFTSPIRRYSDLILHRILKSLIQNNTKHKQWLQEGLEELCEIINSLEKTTDKLSWEFVDRKFARWAEQNNGEIFNAIVIENDRNTMAKLENGARVFLSQTNLNLLEKTKVMLIEADIATAKIYAKVIKNV